MNANTSAEQPGHQSETTRNVVRYLVREAMGLLMLAATLFLPAGRLDWVMGWALVGIMLAWSTATALVVITRNPELLAERTGPRKGAKTWDMVILSIIGLATIARCIVAGLDERFGWSPPLAVAIQVVALILFALAQGLFTWAMVANKFFSTSVRIQMERDHTVASGGPYRVVRHPGYVGYIVSSFATSLALGSLWAFIPAVLTMCLLVVRTALEDRTLLEELDGYKEYAGRVRYRLLPGIW